MHCNLFRLLVVLVSLVVDDVEELELVDTARGGDDAEPVTELLLLEELLGPVDRGSALCSHTYMCTLQLGRAKRRLKTKRTGT
jgi:hypothetical protein